MAPKVMSGARAKLQIYDPVKGTITLGIFANVSYAMSYDAQPVYILGRFSAASIDYTAQEVVQVTASGFRVYNEGAHKHASVPELGKLLESEYITLQIVDRVNPAKPIAVIRNVRPTGYSTSISARQLEEITVNFVGILVDDEDTVNEEAPSTPPPLTRGGP